MQVFHLLGKLISKYFILFDAIVNGFLSFFLKNIYLFGCAGSQLWHMGSLLLLVVAHGIFQLQRAGSSSLTRDRTWAPCVGSTESFFSFFVFGCIGSSLLHTGFLQLRRVGATLHCGMRPFHCSGSSCCGAQALGVQASVVAVRGLGSCGSWALERRLSSCGARAQLLCGMWDLPGPGLEPVFPALAGGFLTTALPGKSLDLFLNFLFWIVHCY